MEVLESSQSPEHFPSSRDHVNLTYLKSLVLWQCHNMSNFIEIESKEQKYSIIILLMWREWIIHGFKVSVNNSNYLLLKDIRPTESTLTILIEHLLSGSIQQASEPKSTVCECVYVCVCFWFSRWSLYTVLCWPLI